jgi:CRP/FNR family cyclic AMP-dependent transcriptional regulator
MLNAVPTIRLGRPSRTFDAHASLRSAGVTAASSSCRLSDVIYSQGDAADSVFYIEAGTVKLSVLSHDGREGVIAMLEAGDFFGESALAGRRLRPETATAMTATTVLIIPTGQMTRVLHADNVFAGRFIRHMLARHIRIESDLVDHLLNSSEKRLARTLLLLAHHGQPGQARRVPAISQTTLAQMVGTTRSRVNFFMKRFKRLGFIEEDRGLKVNDSLSTVLLRNDTVDAPARRTG